MADGAEVVGKDDNEEGGFVFCVSETIFQFTICWQRMSDNCYNH